MAKKKKYAAAAPRPQQRSDTGGAISWLCSPEAFAQLMPGYTRLSENPEIQTAMQRVADLVSSMTIHLMENTKDGDRRIKNELSRKIDITPCRYTTRKAWIEKSVKDMLDGGNSIHLPHFSNGLLDDIEPIPASRVQIHDLDYGYYVTIRGARYEHDELLHFSYNQDPERPWRGRGYTVLLKHIAKQLAQARRTTLALMESPTPSIIVKVDGLIPEFTTVEGRKKLGAQYLDSSENGRPWFIPAENFSIEQVKPLNLKDLAIIDSITLDKKTAASIIGVPAFIVGAGDFDADEYNNFVRTIVLPIARSIEQELTRKLLISPNWYFRFNPRSLYAYSLAELAEVNCNMVDRAIIDRNEARDALGYNPREGLSELAILENYIPYSKIGDQKKLEQKESSKKKPKKGGDADGETQ